MRWLTYEDQMRNVVLLGDVREKLKEVPDGVVQTCVTSPPYFGLRDYGTGKWEGGDPSCPHGVTRWDGPKQTQGAQSGHSSKANCLSRTVCHCGAKRIDSQIGLEQTPDAYVAEMVKVFREVRRVLRDDGTLWLNLASSYVSGRIQSDHAIIREDLTDEEYWEALSGLWGEYEPAESDVSEMPLEEHSASRELPYEGVPQVRGPLHDPSKSDTHGAGDVLLSQLCEIGKSDTKEANPTSVVQDVRYSVREVCCGDQEESARQALLQSDVLVQLQSAGQPLSLVGRAERENVSRSGEMAQGGAETRSVPLSPVSHGGLSGSPSYPPVLDASRASVGRVERGDFVPRLPPTVSPSRNGVRPHSAVHRVHPRRRLEITVRFSEIPEHLYRYFRPAYVLKPKDDAQIPARVALALQADGWYLRSDIIWAKGNVMPESVTDRPTKAHEYIFLLTKNERYFYDHEAVREPAVTTHMPGAKVTETFHYGAGNGGNSGLTDLLSRYKESGLPQTRNRRTVWYINPKPYKGAHFATFPEELPEICIRAGSKEGDLVLDPFSGSGTTLAVAKYLRRDYLGVELNPEYHKLIEERLRPAEDLEKERQGFDAMMGLDQE